MNNRTALSLHTACPGLPPRICVQTPRGLSILRVGVWTVAVLSLLYGPLYTLCGLYTLLYSTLPSLCTATAVDCCGQRLEGERVLWWVCLSLWFPVVPCAPPTLSLPLPLPLPVRV